MENSTFNKKIVFLLIGILILPFFTNAESILNNKALQTTMVQDSSSGAYDEIQKEELVEIKIEQKDLVQGLPVGDVNYNENIAMEHTKVDIKELINKNIFSVGVISIVVVILVILVMVFVVKVDKYKKLTIGVGIFFVISIGIAMIFSIKLANVLNTSSKVSDKKDDKNKVVVYEEEYNKFVSTIACGAEGFQNPSIKTVSCGMPRVITEIDDEINILLKGSVVTVKNVTLPDFRISVNGSNGVYTDDNGMFTLSVKISKDKGVINITGDSFGYAPVREILNINMNNGNYKNITNGDVYEVTLLSKEIEIQEVVVLEGQDIVIKSLKYDKVAITIPKDGLVDINGRDVVGEVTCEITYLNPNDTDDNKLIPGVGGNKRRMIGVNNYGQQGVLNNKGITFFIFRKKYSGDLLTLKSGVIANVVRPLVYGHEDEYEYLIINENDENLDKSLKTAFLSDKNRLQYQYWWYNASIGLWESWRGVGESIIDKNNGSHSMDVEIFN